MSLAHQVLPGYIVVDYTLQHLNTLYRGNGAMTSTNALKVRRVVDLIPAASTQKDHLNVSATEASHVTQQAVVLLSKECV